MRAARGNVHGPEHERKSRDMTNPTDRQQPAEADRPYDVTVIGGGPGGYVAAIRAAQLGARVALVEKERLGGTCLNRGCIPTKAMVRDAELYRDVVSGKFGLVVDNPRVDYARLVARRRDVVENVVGGVERLMQTNGVHVHRGFGRIASRDRVVVTGNDGERELATRSIVIATGSAPCRTPIPGNDLPCVITSDELLAMEEQPRRLVVIGAGAVGVEFACIFRALGSEVTLLERDSFLRMSEQQLARRLRMEMGRQGIDVTIGVDFREIARGENGTLQVRYERSGTPAVAEGDYVLLATGRAPCIEGLGLEEVGVRLQGPGVVVDEYLETSVPGIYAIGDVLAGYMLAHVASREGTVAVENILTGAKRPMDYRVVPDTVFSIPEISGVGLTEAEAKSQGLRYQVSRFPLSANGRAQALGEPEGQVRMICELDDDGVAGRVLGVHILGAGAGDLIAEAAMAMRMGATAKDIAETIHQHPTVAEAVMEAAMAQRDGAIHYDKIG